MKSGLFCVLSHRLIAPQYSRFNPYTFTEATIATIRPHIFLKPSQPPFAIYRKIRELMKISLRLILPAKLKIVSAAKKKETVKIKVKVKP